MSCMTQLTSFVGYLEDEHITPPLAIGPTPSELLDIPLEGSTEIGEHLWGYNGLHGGLALALTAIAMSSTGERSRLRSITGQFLRASRSEIDISARPVHEGRFVQTMTAVLQSGGKPAIHATGTFSVEGEPSYQPRGPQPATSGDPLDYEIYSMPVEFVPILRYIEIRPVGVERPLAGGDKPELTAWIRLTGDDTPIDVPRLITLADALAPSYTAILNELKMLPTIELTVRPGEALTRTSSPWALLHARTTSATADGWVNEEIDLWSPDGGHLGNASQLRVLR